MSSRPTALPDAPNREQPSAGPRWTACARAMVLALFVSSAGAQSGPPATSPASAPDITLRTQDFRAPVAEPPPKWITVPRLSGRLGVDSLGLVINTLDPYSVAVGEYYIRARRLKAAQVLRVELPVKPVLNPEELKTLHAAIDHQFGADIQALALAWVAPYAVGCNSITGALALGYDGELCSHTCAPSRRSPYFDAATTAPYTDLHLRPSMLLAARSVDEAKAMIRRGVASDRTLGQRGAPPVNVYFVKTHDAARSVRSTLFPPAGLLARAGIDVHVEQTDALVDPQRVLVYQTGLVRVSGLEQVKWVPGALADHLTSTGGALIAGGQMPATAWIDAGATASYGTVSEPCNHREKFPHPQVMLLNYVQGSTALEAYWKSVAWPQQGLFIGEPLAAPFARR